MAPERHLHSVFRTVACVVLVASIALASKPEVTIPQGTLRGTTVNGFRVFHGIPFAAPPLGDLRFRPPQPAPSWEDVRDATEFHASCIQPGSPQTGQDKGWPTINLTTSSEDCLFLSVYTPADTSRRYPVMVYFHAGEFLYGASNDQESRFPYFSSEIILVTPNARLGVLGFGVLPEFASLDPTGSVGNVGMMDQQAALRWVRDNIARFGGDPKTVTIFGESSGGSSVAYHLTNRASFGLFHRAIGQSPGLTQTKTKDNALANTRYLANRMHYVTSEPKCKWSTSSTPTFTAYPYEYFTSLGAADFTVPATREEYDKGSNALWWATASQKCLSNDSCVGFDTRYTNGAVEVRLSHGHLMDLSGVSRKDSVVYIKFGEMDHFECLRAAEAAHLMQYSSPKLPFSDDFFTDQFAPVVDGVHLTDTIPSLFRKGEIAPDVPVIMGTNKDEGTIMMSLLPPISCNATYEDFKRWLRTAFGEEKAKKLVGMYNALVPPIPKCQGKEGLWNAAAMRAAGDASLLCPVQEALTHIAANGAPAYQYFFALTPTFSLNYNDLESLGAFHGAEVPFVFNYPAELKTPTERALASTMGCYWVGLARTGDPNSCTKAGRWQAVRGRRDAPAMVFDEHGGHMLQALKTEQCNVFTPPKQVTHLRGLGGKSLSIWAIVGIILGIILIIGTYVHISKTAEGLQDLSSAGEEEEDELDLRSGSEGHLDHV